VVVPADLADPTTGAFRQDLVMTVFLQNTFPDWMFTIISVVLLAAAMSTLDGLMVGISTITANDLVLNLLSRGGGRQRTDAEKMRLALRASHWVLVVCAVIVFFITLHPPKLLGIFGQAGVYGLVLAAVPPLLAGVLFRQPRLYLVWVMSVLGLVIHFGLFFFGKGWFPSSTLAFANPGVTAAIALLATVLPTLIIHRIFDNQ
jgi:Na+/proline symporter